MKLWERDVTQIRQIRGKSIYGGTELPRRGSRCFSRDTGQRDQGNQHCKSEWVVCLDCSILLGMWWSGRDREGPSHKLAVCL